MGSSSEEYPLSFVSESSPEKLRLHSDPLWKIFPTHAGDGSFLSDFMMIMPGFKKLTQSEIEKKIRILSDIMDSYKHAVVFAELNLKINSLLVSVRPIPGICLELPMVIHSCVPEAKLVSQ